MRMAEFSGRLAKIQKSGVLSVGHREQATPLSYCDTSHKVIGYSIDYLEPIVTALKSELGLSELRVSYTPVTAHSRVPLLLNDTIDIECGATTHNEDREQSVAFSNTVMTTQTRILTKAKDGTPACKDFPDLAGKQVAVTAGSTPERLLRVMNTEQQARMSIVSAKSSGEAFKMLESGRAVAYVDNDVLLAGKLAVARDPGNWCITGTPQSSEVIAFMLPKDDHAFKEVIDGAIAATQSEGEAASRYDRWFGRPIPPRSISLNIPLSDALKTVFASPNDKPAPGN